MLDDDDVQRASQGDRSAFERIVRATYGRTLRIARRILAHEADANDVVQEVYTRAFVALREGRFRGRSSQLQAWLDRIVVRASLDALRQRVRSVRRVDDSQDPDATGGAAADPARAIDAKRAIDAIRELAPDQRAAFVLRELEGLTIKETAAALETTDGAVEQRVLRAWASLRRRLSS
jgi:RNA polymerase sigma-70 factor (ECF subfamily)